jgi:K+-transporting ATPase ATPase A chain
MPGTDLLQVALYFLVLTGGALVLGRWMAGILDHPKSSRFDTLLTRLGGYRADEGMNWKRYLSAVLLFNAVGFIALLALHLLQKSLPGDPSGLENVFLPLALNTAINFVTNTNWEAYSGEAMMSYFIYAYARARRAEPPERRHRHRGVAGAGAWVACESCGLARQCMA